MKQLPETIVLEKAIQAQKVYQGKMPLSSFSRLEQSLASSSGEVEFSLIFQKALPLLGKVTVAVKADLPLRCQISEKEFNYPVDTQAVVGFIESLQDEELIGPDMEAAIVKDGTIAPLDLIEDELILAMPYVPISPEEMEKEEKTHSIAVPSKDEQEANNPFSILKSLK